MYRRTLLLSLLAVLSVAAPIWAAQAEQDRADLARIEAYLNSIRTLSGNFLQVAPDGGASEGEVWLRRPGRVRFEYAPPTPILVVADGFFLVFHDKQLGQTDRIPLGNSPLSVLLRDEVKFGGPVTVKRVERGPGAIRVTVFDSDKPHEGELTLVFSENPLALKQWLVTDARGQTTSVSLSDVQLNQPLPNRLFVFTDPPPGERWHR